MTTAHHETAGLIADELERTAYWREGTTSHFPDDTRNAEAARLCTRLAEQFREGKYDPDLIARYQNIIDADEGDGVYLLVEVENELRKNIGFHFWPDAPDDYLRSVIINSRAYEADDEVAA